MKTTKQNNNSEIKIDKNVPIPMPARHRYPFAKMEVGDSVFVEGKVSGEMSGYYTRFKPKRFSCRRENGGVRIWRIE